MACTGALLVADRHPPPYVPISHVVRFSQDTLTVYASPPCASCLQPPSPLIFSCKASYFVFLRLEVSYRIVNSYCNALIRIVSFPTSSRAATCTYFNHVVPSFALCSHLHPLVAGPILTHQVGRFIVVHHHSELPLPVLYLPISLCSPGLTTMTLGGVFGRCIGICCLGGE